jgi:hypothetical protein
MVRYKVSAKLCFILFLLAIFLMAAHAQPEDALTDQQKQQEILNMVNSYRGMLPSELVLAIIRLEGGEGAFYVDSWNYNSFYEQSDGSWAQPANGDGIMQVTDSSGFHNTFDRTQSGYDLAISSGCSYLSDLDNTYGTYAQTVLHYNTGPNSLYIYLGKNQGDRQYLSHVADYISNFIPNMYGLQNQKLVDSLNSGQGILNEYLYNRGLETGRSSDYYKSSQIQLDEDLHGTIKYPHEFFTLKWDENGHYYQVAEGTMNWEAAKAYAGSRQITDPDTGVIYRGHLVTITSPDESSWIFQNIVSPLNVQSCAWIGGSQEEGNENDPSGGWHWLTNEPWEWTNWNSGEPNDDGSNERYLEMWTSDGSWNDEKFDGYPSEGGTKYFIVEYE